MAKSKNEDFVIEEEDDDDEEVLVVYDIATYPSDNTLRVLFEMWERKDITIPDFQRGFVWSLKQSSLLIESFLIGLPVPPIFFYIDEENKNLVVDGQQRLLSVIFFFEGYFGHETEKGKRQVFKLTGLNKQSKYHNKRFVELEPSDKRKLENSVLRAVNIRQLSPKEENTSIYHIFERLNTGGTPLTAQEIRNVVFRGEFFRELKALNKDTNWRKIIGKKTADKHQKDIELLLRGFALSNDLKHYEKPMKEFLNKTAKKHKKGDTDAVHSFIKKFPKTTSVIADTLRERPFNVRGPLNTSVFDTVFSVVFNNLTKIPKNLHDRYEKLLKDKKFEELTSIGTTDTKTVKERYEYVRKLLID